ncbi:MAG TPA: cytochrome ubiquinol oxidase subunit I, partial [Solirubrobacteraceae bacterium]|nr:cytochrome ubiquinol oxidase subunit I [Solirubrobacteraceae bacterium]
NTDVRIPHLLSILGTTSWNGKVEGVNQLNAEDQAKYGPGDYVPILGVTYWTFRLMAGVGVLLLLIPLIGLWLSRRKALERSRRFLWLCVAGAGLPVIANLTGWIFTEMGRQPWVVYGLLKTSDARSPLVGSGSIVLTIVGYTLLYGALLLVGGRLFLRDIAHGPEPQREDEDAEQGEPRHHDLVLAY